MTKIETIVASGLATSEIARKALQVAWAQVSSTPADASAYYADLGAEDPEALRWEAAEALVLHGWDLDTLRGALS